MCRSGATEHRTFVFECSTMFADIQMFESSNVRKPNVRMFGNQSSETGGRNYSVQKRHYILFEISITCQNRLFRPSSFISLDHPLTFLGTDWFYPQRPSSFYFSTVHYHSLRSSNFISFGFQDRSLSKTVHFESFGPSSMILDQSVGPSSLTTDRSLWSKTVRFMENNLWNTWIFAHVRMFESSDVR